MRHTLGLGGRDFVMRLGGRDFVMPLDTHLMMLQVQWLDLPSWRNHFSLMYYRQMRYLASHS
jgi:hypothetical protein